MSQVLSVFIWAYLCHLWLLRWSALRICLCIVSLFCGACWASAPCSAPIWAWCVEICLHILGSTTHWCEVQPNSAPIHFIFYGGRTNRTPHFHYFHSVAITTTIYCAFQRLSYQSLAALIFYLVSASISCKRHWAIIIFFAVCIWRNVKL